MKIHILFATYEWHLLLVILQGACGMILEVPGNANFYWCSTFKITPISFSRADNGMLIFRIAPVTSDIISNHFIVQNVSMFHFKSTAIECSTSVSLILFPVVQ